MIVDEIFMKIRGSFCTFCRRLWATDSYMRVHAWKLAIGNRRTDAAMTLRKRSLFARLSGQVLEIGPGTGTNIPYFPKGIHWIGLEPNRFMHAYLLKSIKDQIESYEIVTGNAEQLPFANESIDAVVCTLVLCTIGEPEETLQEIVRVLKPGGRLLFYEHVAAPSGSWLRTAQATVRPFWALLAGGCRVDQETVRLIELAGFTEIHVEYFSAKRFGLWVPFVQPHVAGCAIK